MYTSGLFKLGCCADGDVYVYTMALALALAMGGRY
jgi:hypothetical protein